MSIITGGSINSAFAAGSAIASAARSTSFIQVVPAGSTFSMASLDQVLKPSNEQHNRLLTGVAAAPLIREGRIARRRAQHETPSLPTLERIEKLLQEQAPHIAQNYGADAFKAAVQFVFKSIRKASSLTTWIDEEGRLKDESIVVAEGIAESESKENNPVPSREEIAGLIRDALPEFAKTHDDAALSKMAHALHMLITAAPSQQDRQMWIRDGRLTDMALGFAQQQTFK